MSPKTLVEKITSWIGSVQSLILHTAVFASSFVLTFSGLVSWSFMLLVLTTVLSLEAIYLAIFIQMTVNRQSKEIAEVSEDVGDIQGDIQEISNDMDAIQKDVDEIQEDVEEITDETEDSPEDPSAIAITQLTRDIRRILEDLEHLKERGQK